MELALNEIGAMLGIPLSGRGEGNRVIDTLLTDSRSIFRPDSTLFFALKTKSNDGHNFIPDLYGRGIRAFVVSRLPEDVSAFPEATWLIVPDTLEALRTVGSAGRKNARLTVAITGSQGKTTLKEWLFQLLSGKYRIARSPRSFNSQIGVPLSLWEIQPGTDIALVEAGISRPGEMKRLREIIRPDVVILTNILANHDEGFRDRDEKALEKVRLAAGAETKSVIYQDSKGFDKAVLSLPEGKDILRWSDRDSGDTLCVISRESSPSRPGFAEVRFRWNGEEGKIEVPSIHEWDVENGINALAFLLSSGLYSVGDPQMVEGFGNLRSVKTRLDVIEGVNGCSLIHDSYSPGYSTLRPALDFMRRRLTPGQTQTLVLSDLETEGRNAEDVYRETAGLLRQAGIDRLICVGAEIERFRSILPEGSRFFCSTDELLATLTTSDFTNEIILLKGGDRFLFNRIVESLEARTHETVLEVNLDALLRNYNYFRSHVPRNTGIVAMVKASGYGAGSYEIAKTLQDAGAAYLAVAVLDEGIDLRNRGITMPIMVMNPKVVNYRQMFAARLEPEIYSLDMLRDVAREARKNGITAYPVHIKLDTGMHRMGFIEEELPELTAMLASMPEVSLRSVFSHLATADCPDMNEQTQRQLDTFVRETDFIASHYPHPFMRHILNTAGILRFSDYHFDMVRLGIGLYGVNTLPPEMEMPLQPVSTLRTIITSLREWEAGECVGYGGKGVLKRKSVIATVPIGYADGMNRHFGNGNVSVLVNGKEVPTVGNICMDACMLDVTDVECKVGDSVEIFGPNASVDRLARVLDTIPYEILTSVSPRVKRVYYRE